MVKRRLDSADEVFEASGGIPGVMKLTGAEYKQVHNWKQEGSFPPRYLTVMTTPLLRQGYKPNPALWRQVGVGGIELRVAS